MANVNKPGMRAIDVLNVQNKQRKDAGKPVLNVRTQPRGWDQNWMPMPPMKPRLHVPSRFKAEMFEGLVPIDQFRMWRDCECNMCQDMMREAAESIGVQNLHIKRSALNARMLVAVSVKVAKKPSAFSSGRDYSNWLEDRGYVRLGGGAFSNVYLHPKCKDRVIKVNLSMDTWPVFAVWAQYQPETFGIKMYSFKQHINTKPGTKSFYVAVLERIENVAADSGQSDLRSAVDRCIGRYGAKMRMDGAIETDEDDFDEAAMKARYRWIERKQPGLMAYCQKLKDNDLIDDLHARNWGFRPDGSLVIFDPSHDGGTEETKSVASETKRYKRAA